MDDMNAETSLAQSSDLAEKKAAKMKILLVVNIVVIIALLVVMMTLKNGYAEQAKNSVMVQTRSYTEKVQEISFEQDQFVEEWGELWNLIFLTLWASDQSEQMFQNRMQALETEYNAQPEKTEMWKKWGREGFAFPLTFENGIYKISCGVDCFVSFTFTQGVLSDLDYSALALLDLSSKYQITPPTPFNFQAK